MASPVGPRMTTGLSRFACELATAGATAVAGAVIIVGAREYGVGWANGGPQAGTFPFYVGLAIVAASLVNLALAFKHKATGELFLDPVRTASVAKFVLPIVAFLVVTLVLGLYVATALYLAGVMRLQGKYRWITSATVAIATVAFFYVVLDVWFKVPLLKGPLEAALGIY